MEDMTTDTTKKREEIKDRQTKTGDDVIIRT